MSEPVYFTMDWFQNAGLSYLIVFILSVVVILAQILIHYLQYLREFIVYKIERNFRIRQAEKDARIRRSQYRRMKIDHLLATCTSTEVFKYVSKHTGLFNEVMKELGEGQVNSLAIEELKELLREAESNKQKTDVREEAARRINAHLQKTLKDMNVNFDANGEVTEPGSVIDPELRPKFTDFMSGFMRALRNRKRKMAEAKAEAEKLESMGGTEQKPWTEKPKKWLPPSGTKSMDDYIKGFQKKPDKHPPIILGNQNAKMDQAHTIASYEDMYDPPPTKDTFSGD